MNTGNKPIDTFDRGRRRLVRERAGNRAGNNGFLNQIMAEDLTERLSLVNRQFEHCLLIGSAPPALRDHLESQKISVISVNSDNAAVECDEDRLPFADESFDLIICIGMLDTVNDLPGALILIRRILKPDGLFLATFPGAESLPVLKSILMEAEGDRVAAHIHPQIDVRTLGDLMMRAGFALPVADNQNLKLRYRALEDLIRDIRDYGGSNVMIGNLVPISKRIYARAKTGFESRFDAESKITEIVELLYLCGWAPHPDQPKPAKRGSGQVSLETALGNDTKHSDSAD